MIHKEQVDLDSLKTLEKCEPEALQARSVTAVLLALGSNYQAETYLPIARKHLADLGQIQLSTAFQNPDFTATLEFPKPDYTNQCVYLSLKKPMTLQQLQQTFKQFEWECHRQRLTEPQMPIKKVTMDIDVLLASLLADHADENSLSKNLISKWVILTDRYPFKAHELTGIEELMENGFLRE